jgi:N-acyl-D-amino-acid deacylase
MGPLAAATAFVTTLILHASVLDGTGTPARNVSVRLDMGRVVEIGDLQPRAGETVVDAKGLTLAPGFIDTHSHADADVFEHPDALGATSQGITTIVGGQDGESFWPLKRYFKKLERHPPAVNVASYSGHGTMRSKVMGDDFRRAATPDEVARMEKMVRKDMEAGALGLATGLEYDPGIYSDPSEVVALAKVASQYGGRYISHIRSEDRHFWEAIDEIINIGREAHLPVQVSHTKLAMKSWWGQADKLIARLDAARAEGIDITGDIYPYLYWHSTLTVLFPKRDFADLNEARLVVNEIVPPEGLVLTQYDAEPKWVGKNLAEIAAERSEAPEATLVMLLKRAEERRAKTGDAGEGILGTSMTEEDLAALLRWPHMNLCTDGSLDGSHPRGFGTYPRILGRYVREQGVLTLPEAVHRASGLAAEHMGFTDRGFIRPGQVADLVLFDPATVIDRATNAEPHRLADGIRTVWVGGVVVYQDGRDTGARPGRVLRNSRIQGARTPLP